MIGIVVGTRPEIIKMLPIIEELKKRKIEYAIINTLQSYDYNMNEIFLKEFGINYNYNNYIEVPDRKIEALNHFYSKNKFDIILVLGDTDTAFYNALYAKRNGIPIGHVEAGLRCGDLYMYEEQNRIFIDHIADLNFAPTGHAYNHLRDEGIALQRIYVTGNTIVESLDYILHDFNTKTLLENYTEKVLCILLTIHRRENIHNINKILSLVDYIAEQMSYKVIFPCHPHTQEFIEFKMYKNIKIIEPINYKEFLEKLLTCVFVITDSGGVQEESCILGIKCITFRDSTERPETIGLNNILINYKLKDEKLLYQDLHIKIRDFVNEKRKYDHPYGKKGTISKKIVNITNKFIN